MMISRSAGHSDRALRGHEQFAGYVDMVTQALGQYTTDILDLVEEGDKVFGKVRFHGIHRKELLGVAPTGRMSGGMAPRCSPSRMARCATFGCLVISMDCSGGCNSPAAAPEPP